MGKRVSFKHKRKAAPEWVFSWRRAGESLFPKAFAILLAGGAFVFFVTSVRIRVTPPRPWAVRKASVIQVTDDAEGRALTLRAREGGPFPSRFEPSEWEGALSLEQAALEAARWTPPPYVPVLRDLPDKGVPPVPLAAKGESVLPKRSPLPVVAPVPGKLRLAPVLYPLSGITPASMPRDLPPFDGELDNKLTAGSWRFLLRLDAAGTVHDCISLADGSSPLENWLSRVSFNAEPAKQSRWIAVGVDFTNQPADGTESR